MSFGGAEGCGGGGGDGSGGDGSGGGGGCSGESTASTRCSEAVPGLKRQNIVTTTRIAPDGNYLGPGAAWQLSVGPPHKR